MKMTMKRLWLAAVLTLCAGATATAYELTVAQSAHGTVGFSVGGNATTSSAPGQAVTVSIRPDDGYAVETVTATACTAWEKAAARRHAPALVRELTLTGSGTEWVLTMPEADVEVSVTYLPAIVRCEAEAEQSESGKSLSGVEMTLRVTDWQENTATVWRITVPEALAGEPIAVHIPATTAGYTVTAIAAGAIASDAGVTDIYLPDTERPLAIDGEALPGTAVIHTPLALLDDYALTPALRTNYESLKVMATVVPASDSWTLSSGVDVVLPEGLRPHVAYADGDAVRIEPISGEALLLAGGRKGVKANNGVLLTGQPGVSYDLTASPGRQQSGTVPATADARSYGDRNQLEPVIERRHYAAGECLVLKDNRFHSIRSSQSKVRACRAVLRVK